MSDADRQGQERARRDGCRPGAQGDRHRSRLRARLPGLDEGERHLRADEPGRREGRAGPADLRASHQEEVVSDAVGAGIDPAIKSYIDGRLTALRQDIPDNRVTLVVFSGELDRQLASLVIATGA